MCKKHQFEIQCGEQMIKDIHTEENQTRGGSLGTHEEENDI